MTVTIVETRVQARAITGGAGHPRRRARRRRARARSAGCWAWKSSRPPRPGAPSCWAGWVGSGTVCLVGVEGTGSYGAGLARHLAVAGIRVVEVGRADRQDRRRQGKSDPLDAVSAARAALSGRACGAPEGRDGQVEAIRALMVAKRSARAGRTQTINQARALIVTGPEDIRTGFACYAGPSLHLRPVPG